MVASLGLIAVVRQIVEFCCRICRRIAIIV